MREPKNHGTYKNLKGFLEGISYIFTIFNHKNYPAFLSEKINLYNAALV